MKDVTYLVIDISLYSNKKQMELIFGCFVSGIKQRQFIAIHVEHSFLVPSLVDKDEGTFI